MGNQCDFSFFYVYSSSQYDAKLNGHFIFCLKGEKLVVKVGVIMGSISDWSTMAHTVSVLSELGIEYEKEIISAHRTPNDMFLYAESARERGLEVIIAGAGGAAHLPGMVASKTTLPVIGVPVESRALKGMDSLLSIVQMPGGVPTATMAIGTAGAKNAGIFAAQILSVSDTKLAEKLEVYRQDMRDNVTEMRDELARK